MELNELIKHPELMDKETLYDLRSLLALYPYYQPARLLMLQNLYLLHDPTFDEELRRAAIYITDRRKLFNLVEAAHYQIRPRSKDHAQGLHAKDEKSSRTIALIDNFLDSMPKDEAPETTDQPKRKPTPADATVDYVSYLLEIESDDDEPGSTKAPEMKGQSLIDNFIDNEGGRIQLQDEINYTPDDEYVNDDNDGDTDEGYFTETLAKIYIKQGRYSKALEIIQRLNLIYPKKNAYFADQIRFLEKLILNEQAN